MQPAARPPAAAGLELAGVLVEQLRQLLRHRAAQLLGVGNRHGPVVIARHVMADADGDKLHRRALLDLSDDEAKVAFEIYFLRKIRRGTSEPLYERFLLDRLNIRKVKQTT